MNTNIMYKSLLGMWNQYSSIDLLVDEPGEYYLNLLTGKTVLAKEYPELQNEDTYCKVRYRGAYTFKHVKFLSVNEYFWSCTRQDVLLTKEQVKKIKAYQLIQQVKL